MKNQPLFQNKAPNNMSIVKFETFIPEVEILELKSNRENLHESLPGVSKKVYKVIIKGNLKLITSIINM